ncbi:hypothetical protein [Fodinicola feengrottensis]|uniref:hypothetical protein n=1 Tax=Fodinicola feengrottensis TaxID=435914 RepID=UPI00244166CE|nr:hypothetical protein [Fodinicola feengrottensis]
MNYRDATGAWQHIDVSLARTGDGRWREKANSLALDVAGSAADPALVRLGLDGALDRGRVFSYGLAGAQRRWRRRCLGRRRRTRACCRVRTFGWSRRRRV